MFVVWLGALITATLTLDPELFGPSTASAAYNGAVTLILLLTVWFANAAEALAEGRGQAKAAALRRTKTELTARRIQPTGEFELVPAAQAAYIASFFDTTPEGRTIVAFAQKQGASREDLPDGAHPLDFSAETRMSGLDLPDGRIVRKGTIDAVAQHVAHAFDAAEPPDLRSAADRVARQGATPLAVSVDGHVLGVIALSDVPKPGMRERIVRLRDMGIRTVMVTGDNPVTAWQSPRRSASMISWQRQNRRKSSS